MKKCNFKDCETEMSDGSPDFCPEHDNKAYDIFIRKGLSVGFTDDQIDFLESYIKP